MTSSARARDGGLAFGDMAAVFRAHRAELVRLAAFILADKGAGEDVVQDVFAQMHARQGKLGDRGQGTPALGRTCLITGSRIRRSSSICVRPGLTAGFWSRSGS